MLSRKILPCVCALLLLSACKERYPTVNVNLEQKSPSTTTVKSGNELKFILAAMISPRETVKEYAIIVKALGKALGRDIRLVHGKNYQDVNNLLLAGKVDLGWVCTGGYIDLKKSAPKVEILTVPQIDGKTTYNSLIVVGPQSTAKNFNDLKGGRFAFVDPLSQTGFRYPQSLLRERKVTKDLFFASYVFAGTHDRAIAAVQRGVSDAAAIDELVFSFLKKTRPEAIKGLRTINRSPDYGIPPIVASPKSSANDRKKWKAALLNLHRSPEIKSHLSAIGVDKFTHAQLQLYQQD